MRFRILLCALSLGALALTAACSSQERLTSRATPCTTKQVRIINSEFSRRGVTTAWCAECKNVLYQCASNGERTRVECRESRAEDVCH
ncbi:MAG: hypothetical protein ABI612_16205 [Betaproteobacteria bacterium]